MSLPSARAKAPGCMPGIPTPVRPRLARQQEPQVDVEEHALLVLAFGVAQGKGGRAAVLDGDETGPERADVAAAGQLDPLQHFGPGINSVAGKAGANVPPAVDGGDVKGVGKPVE